uniref:NPH3 domain-containing protein n=2 Tax=Physcomitrium patens TaxID=3218 RepID=A0A7I4FM39_PHYPA
HGYSATSLSPMKPHGDGDEDTSSNHGERIQREVVEVVNLLANLERKSVSCRSLLELRRIAVAVRAGKHCRRDLERMIGRQLEKATLDNILIPALPPRSSSLYDVDLVLRLVEFFLKEKADALFLTSNCKGSESCESLYSSRLDNRFSLLSRTNSRVSAPVTALSSEISTPLQTSLLKVGQLMDKYLAEIAADAYLKPSKFLALAESLPDYARQSDDGLYRAVDIFLEAHPFVSETDATRLFKVLNYHKLGPETCKAAAQNPRFPPSFAIQVALVQRNQLKTTSEGSFRSDRSYSPFKNNSPRVGQQTVVHLQCSSFEFTLRQEKKINVKKAQASRLEIQSSCKRSRVEMPGGFHRLMQLFNSKSRQH